MEAATFPVIDLVATGDNIRRLRVARGLSVKDLQRYFGFEEPRAVYKWQNGECLPTVDNLYALGVLLETPMEAILVRRKTHSLANKEQQEDSCCSAFSAVSGTAGRIRPQSFLPARPFRDESRNGLRRRCSITGIEMLAEASVFRKILIRAKDREFGLSTGRKVERASGRFYAERSDARSRHPD